METEGLLITQGPPGHGLQGCIRQVASKQCDTMHAMNGVYHVAHKTATCKLGSNCCACMLSVLAAVRPKPEGWLHSTHS